MRLHNSNSKQSNEVSDSSPMEKKLVQSRLQFKSFGTGPNEKQNKRKFCKSEEESTENELVNSNSNSAEDVSDYKDDEVASTSPKIIIKLPKLKKAENSFASKNNVKSDAHPNKRLKLEACKPVKINEKCNEKLQTIETIDLNSDSSNAEVVLENKNKAVEKKTNAAKAVENISEICAADDTNTIPLKSISPVVAKDRKYVKLSEERRKSRDKKEIKLQQDRLEATIEKEKRELVKKQEREKKIEERKKEKEEKENHKRLEREEKEKKRLAELSAKSEEKRKKTEAKEEEIRKKEEERRRKEQEKEEAEFKKKKAAEGFKKFFVPKDAHNCQEYEHLSKDDLLSQSLAFRPFQIKGDMQLAPVCRKTLSVVSKLELDSLLHNSENSSECLKDFDNIPKLKRTSYLAQLKAGSIIPMKYKNPSIDKKEVEEDDDVCIIDDLERAGQAIEENHATVERHRAKFFKFHENRRPPYFGTWRKKTVLIRPKRPFAKDEKFFDYDVDSDLDWEEEEPGESLDGSDDEKEKESEDDEYEVDNEWFVPHGHLSDEELQTEFENGLSNANDREAQKVKLKIKQQEFAIQMKKKTEKLKPRLLGCIWVDENGNQPKDFPNLIWNTLNKRAMILSTVLNMDEPEEVITNQETGSPPNITEKLKPIVLSDELLKDLIRLIHGNSNSKSFLIKEYITFIEANENSIKNGEARGPLKSMVREKIDEMAEWKVIEDGDITKKNNKNKVKKRLCWIVADHILGNMNMKDLSLNNTWHYMLQPKSNIVIKSKEN